MLSITNNYITNKREKYRHHLSNTLLIIYFLVIFEGVLRKWVLPGFSSAIYFIKDPIVIYALIVSLRFGFFSKNLISTYFIFVAAVFFIVVTAFLLANPEAFIIYGYGLRNYLLYFPLVFIASKVLKLDDVYRFARLTLYTAIPICLLVFLQYTSGPEAFINKGIGDDDFIFMIAEGVVRPYGTFTFTSGHVLYVSACFAFLVAAIFEKQMYTAIFSKNHILFIVTGIAVAVMLFLTGSRSIYAYAAITLLMACLVAITKKSRRNISALAFLAVALTSSVLVFLTTDSYELLVERNQSAIRSEGSPIVRAFSSLYTFTNSYESSPLWGHGIGSGTNAASAILRSSREQGAGFLLAEDEWSRIVLEMGFPVGMIYIFFRVLLLCWLFLKSVNTLKKHSNGIPLILLGFLAPILFNGVMTMQGTTLAFGVLFSCLVLAACKNPKKNSKIQTDN